MAPEIIEMTGTNTACDLWSVGCTIIELLTGKPPYFDLPQVCGYEGVRRRRWGKSGGEEEGSTHFPALARHFDLSVINIVSVLLWPRL